MMPHSGGSIFALGIKNKSTMDWDVLFYKLAANTFDTLWSKQYGGSAEDDMRYMLELPDKSIVIAGTTNSKDGDVWYGHSYSAKEIWVIRVDTFGNILNGKVFGGSGGSDLNALRVSSEGQIYLSGNTLAKDYDFAHVGYGMFDADPWVARLDTQLQLKSVLVLPGNDYEVRPFVENIAPNSVIFGFSSMGTNVEIYGNLSKGLMDLIVMHLDSNLNTKWGKRIGGSHHDAADGICRKLNNGKFAIVGRTQSCDGDISFKRDCGTGPGATVSMLLAIMDTQGAVHHCKAYGDSNTLNYSISPIGIFVAGPL
ncbi:MAG: hypothetical protein HWD58_12690 [Bacteroidota bacterium]|nr:MAG: hypothetical protein HWD58_12690 [Bacteroidota bacterium]